MDYQKKLKDLNPDHVYLIGINSDGCVFDTMESVVNPDLLLNPLKPLLQSVSFCAGYFE